MLRASLPGVLESDTPSDQPPRPEEPHERRRGAPALPRLRHQSDVDRWIGVPLGGGRDEGAGVGDRHPALGAGHAEPEPAVLRRGATPRRAASGGSSRRSRSWSARATATAPGPRSRATSPAPTCSSAATSGGSSGRASSPATASRLERMLFDYKVTETKFAGPTMFSRGDTTYINQRGELVAQAALDLDPLPAPRRRAAAAPSRTPPSRSWTEDEILAVEREKFEYYRTLPRSRARPPPDREGGREAAARARSARTRSRASPPSGARS